MAFRAFGFMLIHLNSCQQFGHMHDYICWIRSERIDLPPLECIWCCTSATRTFIRWILSFSYPVAFLSGEPPFLENNLNWFQSKNAFLFSGISVFSIFGFGYCPSHSSRHLLFWSSKVFSYLSVFSFWFSVLSFRGKGTGTGTHAFSVKIAFKRNKIWLYNNAWPGDVSKPAYPA